MFRPRIRLILVRLCKPGHYFMYSYLGLIYSTLVPTLCHARSTCQLQTKGCVEQVKTCSHEGLLRHMGAFSCILLSVFEISNHHESIWPLVNILSTFHSPYAGLEQVVFCKYFVGLRAIRYLWIRHELFEWFASIRRTSQHLVGNLHLYAPKHSDDARNFL